MNAPTPSPTLPLGYWIKDRESQDKDFARIPMNAIVRVDADPEHEGQYEVWQGERHWTQCSFEEINTDFSFLPDGEAEVERRINGSNMPVLSAALTAPNAGFGTATTAEGRSMTMTALSELARQRQVEIDSTRLLLKEHAEEVKALIEMRASAMRAKLDREMRKIEKQMKRMQDIMDKMNLYLGAGQNVDWILEGDPAPAGTVIKVFQQTRYADEETAIDADGCGLDFRTFAKFRAWIKANPAVIDQFVPSLRGVCAMQLRRHADVRYSDDPYANALANKDNLQTYFCIRDGARFYVVTMPVNFGDTFFPTRHEFDQFFKDRDGNYLVPNTQEYAKAMQKADKRKQYYLRCLLILQGLLDRTDLFGDLGEGVERPCVTDQKKALQVLEYFYDAERLLSDGRKPFREWLREKHKLTQVGDRIMLFVGRIDKSQVNHNWERPSSMVLYNVDVLTDSRVEFLFDIEEKSWRRNPRRVRAWAYYSDTNWISFDRVTVSELDFYINDRLSRYAYRELLPLLRRVKEMKELEAYEEAPFRLLLVGELMKLGIDITEDEITALIIWRKFKVREHRAIRQDDAGALQMILAEAKRRTDKKRREMRNQDKYAVMIETILRLYPDALYVQELAEGIRFARAENAKNIFMSWWWYKDTGSVLDKSWKTINDGQHKGGKYLYRSERFEAWHCLNSPSSYFTDVEINEMLSKVRNGWSEWWGSFYSDELTEFYCLGEHATKHNSFILGLANMSPLDNHGGWMTCKEEMERSEKPELRVIEFSLTRKKHGKLDIQRSNGHYEKLDRERWLLLEEVPEVKERYRMAKAAYDAKKAAQEELRRRVQCFSWPLERHMRDWTLQKAHDEYIAQGYNEKAWERKQKFEPLKVDGIVEHGTSRAVLKLMYAGIDPHGIMTWYEMMVLAFEHGFEWDTRSGRMDGELFHPVEMFAGYVMNDGRKEEESGEDDEEPEEAEDDFGETATITNADGTVREVPLRWETQLEFEEFQRQAELDAEEAEDDDND